MKWNQCHRPKRYWLCYLVLFFLLSGLGLLFPSSSASAYTLSSAVKDHITGVDLQVPGLRVNTVVNSQNGSGIQFDVTRTSNASWTNDTIYLAVLLETTIPANSVVSVSMSVSHANSSDAPVCFTGDWGTQVIDCDVNGDNTNNTISAIFYTTRALDRLILYSYNSAPNITLGTPAFAIGSVVYSSVQSEALSSSDVSLITDRLRLIVNNTDPSQNGTDIRFNAIISALNGLDIDGVIDVQTETNEKLDTQIELQQEANEQQQEQYEAEKAEEAEREEAATDAQTGTFLGSLSNLLFPFSNFFNMLGGRSCFTPTKINSWLHTQGAQYCPWFSSDVTNTVSTVLGAFSTIIIFGFIIKWLNRSEN